MTDIDFTQHSLANDLDSLFGWDYSSVSAWSDLESGK